MKIYSTVWLQTLYSYGARKFVLIGVGQIGCSPNQLAQNSPDGKTCVERVNSANLIFNNKLRDLVTRLNTEQPDAKFIYINAYGIFQDIIANPAQYGIPIHKSSSTPLSLALFSVSFADNITVSRHGHKWWHCPPRNLRKRKLQKFWSETFENLSLNVLDLSHLVNTLIIYSNGTSKDEILRLQSMKKEGKKKKTSFRLT